MTDRLEGTAMNKKANKWYYHLRNADNVPKWMGVPADKMPTDLWVFQELVYKIRPDFIVEIGTQFGGTTLFFANLLDLIGKGEVITIDVVDVCYPVVKSHPRIIRIIGDSLSVIGKVKALIGDDKKVLVDLDGDHHKGHVLQEIDLYAPLVSNEGYLIVEDTNLRDVGRKDFENDGPIEAVEAFLKNNKEFVVDKTCEKFKMTYNPDGYLKRALMKEGRD